MGLKRHIPLLRDSSEIRLKKEIRMSRRPDLEPLKIENYGEGLYLEKEEMDPELVEMERKIQERIEKEKRNKVQGSNPFGVITALKK
jgi:hypothetical protein